jgi:hypothetical protein
MSMAGACGVYGAEAAAESNEAAPERGAAAVADIDSEAAIAGAGAGAPGPRGGFRREEERTPLVRAQQSLNFLKATRPKLIPAGSPCHHLNFDLVLAIAARNPMAERWAFGEYSLDIQWNGKRNLLLDSNGAHWCANGQKMAEGRAQGPFSLHGRRLTTTIYNPTATSDWSGRHGGMVGQQGMTESLDVTIAEGGQSLSGNFQREFEGPVRCTGRLVQAAAR